MLSWHLRVVLIPLPASWKLSATKLRSFWSATKVWKKLKIRRLPHNRLPPEPSHELPSCEGFFLPRVTHTKNEGGMIIGLTKCILCGNMVVLVRFWGPPSPTAHGPANWSTDRVTHTTGARNVGSRS